MKALSFYSFYNSNELFKVEFLETYKKLVSQSFDFYRLHTVFEEIQIGQYSIVYIRDNCNIDLSKDRMFVNLTTGYQYSFLFENIKTIDDFIHIMKLVGIELTFKKTYVNSVLNG